MDRPTPAHLDETDPAKAGVGDIREEADLELEAYADRDGLVLLIPEDRWAEFLRQAGEAAAEDGDGVLYRGAKFRPGPVTAVIAEEGF
jgi:hypothetical protein